MTIRVKISHDDGGVQEPFHVHTRTQAGAKRTSAPVMTVKPGDTVHLYVYPGHDIVITERHPDDWEGN